MTWRRLAFVCFSGLTIYFHTFPLAFAEFTFGLLEILYSFITCKFACIIATFMSDKKQLQKEN